MDIAGDSASPSTATVTLDGNGVGLVEISADSPQAVRVTVTGSGDDAEVGASAVSHVVSASLPAYRSAFGGALDLRNGDGDVAAFDAPHHGAPATGGMAVALGDRVYFVPALPGSSVSEAANLPYDVEGLQGVHIDNDGVLDLMAWGGNQVVLLRGLSTGGYAWGTGFQAKAGAVVGAVVNDVTGDRVADLVVAASRASGGGVQVLAGDGAWGFEALEPLTLAEEIWSVTADDEYGDGQPDLSVLTAGRGTVKRYTLRDDGVGWVGASTYELVDYEATAGARLMPQVDLDGDGLSEIIIQGADDLSPQDLVFYRLTDPVLRYPLGYPAYDLGLGDLDNDGLDDLLVMQDGRLTLVSYEGDGFRETPINLPSGRGPVSAGRLAGGDDVPELMITSDVSIVVPGSLSTDGWDKERFAWRAFATALTGPMVVADISDDGVGDVVGFTTDGANTVVATWVLSTDGGQLDFGGRLATGPGVTGHGLVRCGTDWYALAGNGDDSSLYRFTITGPPTERVPTLAGVTPVTGTLLACGWLPQGASGAVVANSSGFWVAYNTALDEVGNGNASQSGAVALGDTDGDGLGNVATCTAVGCSVATADLDQDGTDEVARGGDSVSLEWGGERLELGSAGDVSFADFDGDGVRDLLATDTVTGRITVWRTVAGGLAPPIVLTTDREIGLGPAYIADTNGDGIPEIAIVDVDADGRLRTAFSPVSGPRGSAW